MSNLIIKLWSKFGVEVFIDGEIKAINRIMEVTLCNKLFPLKTLMM